MIKKWIEGRQIRRLVLAKNDNIYLRIRRNKNRIERLNKVDQRLFKSEIEELEEENKLLRSELEVFS